MVGTVHVKVVQGSLQAFVGHDSEARYIAQRARLTDLLDTSNARSAETVSAAAGELRLAKYLKADGTLALKLFRQRFNKLNLATFAFSLS